MSQPVSASTPKPAGGPHIPWPISAFSRQMWGFSSRTRIDQVTLEERPNEICTSINVQIRPFLLHKLGK